MEKKIDLRAASPEMIDAILTLAEAVYNLIQEKGADGGRNEMNEAKKTEKQVQATHDVTFEMLRDRLIELARDGKRENIRALLDRYGVRLLTELPREKYGEVYVEVEKW